MHSLQKEKESGDFEKIQVVSTKSVPLLSILRGFWSTVVINFFSWQKAYSIFPRATFIDRRGYMLKDSKEAYATSIAKYSRRGWDFQGTIWSRKPDVSYLEGIRRGGDRHSWVIPFNDLKISHSPEADHNLAYAAFSVEKQSNEGHENDRTSYYEISAQVFTAHVLRYHYLYASSGWRDFLGTKVESLTMTELLKLNPSSRPSWLKVALNQPSAQSRIRQQLRIRKSIGYLPLLAEWTYYDDELPKWYVIRKDLRCPYHLSISPHFIFYERQQALTHVRYLAI